MLRRTLLAAVVSLSIAALAVADTVYTTTGLSFARVEVIGIDGDELRFRNSQGRESTRPINEVARLELDGQRGFNEAEIAFTSRKFGEATDGYLKTIRGGFPEWMKRYAATRLMTAAMEVGRFEDAVAGYVVLAEQAPTEATTRKPAAPNKIGQLDEAADELREALARRPSEEVEQALLSLLLDVERGRKDNAETAKIIERLTVLAGDADGSGLGTAQLADLKLSQAQLALDSGDLDEAAAAINDNAKLFALPRQQASALFTLANIAEARAGQDRQKILDAALAYMKVVAHFESIPDAPHVSASLLKVADLHAQIGETATARQLYEAVAEEYPASDEAAVAERKLGDM
ncbi:MAG: hypothetical protein AAGD32_10585 [Planctomycetota bacterium]